MTTAPPKSSWEFVTERAEAAKQRTRKPSAVPAVGVGQQLDLSFPIWPEQTRGAPNAILRCSLFSVAKERGHIKRTKLLSSLGGIEVRFKGEQFNQTDLDVLEEIIHLARGKKTEYKVSFASNALLRRLGRQAGKSQYEQLKEEIQRLAGGLVEIKDTSGRVFGGTFISSYYRDDNTNQFVLNLNPDLAQLFAQGHTYLNVDERRALGRNHLAKWLHAFFSTHASPFPYTVQKLMELSCGDSIDGEAEGVKREFRRRLKTAAALLVKNTTSFTGITIDANDKVIVGRNPTASQRAHLTRVGATGTK